MPGRELTIKKYNLDLYDALETEGIFNMPIIKKNDYIPSKLIGFNEALSSKNKDTGIHMFIDDYQFERLWNKPQVYLPILRKYECVFTPDFSLYLDMPMAMKVWNTYRNRLLGQFFQKNGLRVIPTISWAEKETYEFCFDGIEPGGSVAIATTGCHKNAYSRFIYEEGVDTMIDKVHPKNILVYGEPIEHDFKSANVFYFKNSFVENARQTEERPRRNIYGR